MSELDGRRVLVTGGSAGIGAAVVEACVGAGARVGFVGRDAERVAAVASSTGSVGVVADVTDAAAVAGAVDELADRLGGLDALVANAGVMLHARISSGSFDDWTRMLDANVVGLLRATHAALPHLRAAAFADVVVIGSTAAAGVAIPDFAVYAATKAAVVRIAEGLRAELAGSGIRVSLVTPGYVRTGGFGPGIRDPGVRERAEALRDRVGLPPRLVADQVRHVLAAPREVCISELVVVPTAT